MTLKFIIHKMNLAVFTFKPLLATQNIPGSIPIP